MSSRSQPGVYDGIADADADTILRVQIADVEELLRHIRAPGKVHDSQEEELMQTLRTHRDDLLRSRHLIRDRRVSNMYAVRLQQDATAIASAIEEERRAEEDHAMACRLAGLPVPPPRPEFANRTIPATPRNLASSANPAASRPLPTPPNSARTMSAAIATPVCRSTPSSTGEVIASPAAAFPTPAECTTKRKREVDAVVAADQPSTRRVSLSRDISELPANSTAVHERSRDNDALQSVEPSAKRLRATSNTASSVKISTVQEAPSSTKRKRDDEEWGDTTSAELPTKKIDTGVAKVIDKAPPASDLIACTACGEDFEEANAAKVACQHTYCRVCLQTLVRIALVDESLYPPRCCKLPFEIDNIRHLLTPELISNFHQKKIEYSIPNRTYCATPECSAFLYPDNITGDKGACAICFGETCTICKGLGHTGDCPKDDGVQKVLALASQNHWRRCNKCQRVVELHTGCNHITCVCKAEWCYVCGVQWKGCNCPRWEEQTLLAQEERNAAVPPAAQNIQPAPEVPPAQQVVARSLRIYHSHLEDYVRVGGYEICDECGRDCNRYHFRCNDCRMELCYACLHGF